MADRTTYPLKSLLEVRRRARRDAEEALARAMERTAVCERAVSRAAAELRSKEQEIQQQRSSVRLERGSLSVHQLATGAAYRDRLAGDVEAARRKLASARRKENEAREKEDQARVSLQEAHKQLEALGKHKARWSDEMRRLEEKAAEENGEEIVQSRLWQRKS